MNRNQIASAVIVLVAAVAGTAFATTGDKNDAHSVLGAKLTLNQAVSAAEQHLKGRAASAEFESSSGKLLYEVEVVAGAKVFEVEVDGMTGQIGKVTEDSKDSDEDEGDDKE
jgi:uncharacterized membrane protein YkoI